MAITNVALERALARLGGVHEASMATGIPAGTLRSCRRRGKVGNYAWIKLLSDASGVPMDELAGYSPPPQRKTA